MHRRQRLSPRSVAVTASARSECSACALIALLLIALLPVRALAQTQAQRPPQGTVRTDTLWSQSLGAHKALTVYLPPSYTAHPTQRFPVLFYLHGLGGNQRNWVDAGALDRTMDSLVAAGQPEAILVMPDGDDGWYASAGSLPDLPACLADSTRREPAATFCVPWPRYDDYIARDIVAHIDARYRTVADRAHRGIAGLSMGGYGAISLALAYPDVFAAAASHSGVLSPRYLGPAPYAPPARYATTLAELRTAARSLWPSQLRAFGRDTIAWIARDPGHLARRAVQPAARRGRAPLPALMVDVGVDDPWIDQNRDFHAILQQLGVSHQYAEWPGAHTWQYWRTHAAESLVFLLGHVADR